MIRIGVLALQGGFAAHGAALDRSGAASTEVRTIRQLEDVDGLVLPGGESTTLLRLMQAEPWFDALRDFAARGGAVLATCAGTIMLAREVHDPIQPSSAILDIVVRRNGYGRQRDSFESEIALDGFERPFPAVFIRAPRIASVGPSVEVLARHRDQPVLVRSGSILAATFHPELTGDDRIHRAFVESAHSLRPENEDVRTLAAR